METSKPVTVKLRRGSWEVEITCPEDRVKRVVEDVIAGLGSNPAIAPEREVPKELTRPQEDASSEEHVICRDLIKMLWSEGWFAEERNLSEVDAELARRGYHYDKTSISHSLADLVRENILRREGSMRNYRYIQKRPP